MHSAIGLGLRSFDGVQNIGSLIKQILILYFYRNRGLPNTTYSSHFQINTYMFSHLSHVCYTPRPNSFSQFHSPSNNDECYLHTDIVIITFWNVTTFQPVKCHIAQTY